MELPEIAAVSAGGNVAKALSQQMNGDDFGMHNEDEEESDLDDLSTRRQK